MDVTPLIPAGWQIIESYGDGRFRVSGRIIEGSVLVFPDRALPWGADSCDALSPESLAEVARAGASGEIQLLLLGCGRRMAAVPAAVRQALREAHVAVEPMDTGAACRTYNVLMAEGRPVCAALIAVA